MGTMSVTNADPTAPMGMLKRPKFQGPGRKRSPTKKTRMTMGMVKATKAAQAPMLKIAPMARSPPNMSRRSRIPTLVLAQTAFTGVLVRVLTWAQ